MFYEDMLHEQKETRTWFEFGDEMSACPIRAHINGTDADYWPDCIEFVTHDSLLAIAPSDALHILEWLEFHRERLTTAANKELQAILESKKDNSHG